MYDKLTEMALAGRLSAPKHKLVKLEEFSSALAESMKGFKAGKLIFELSENWSAFSFILSLCFAIE